MTVFVRLACVLAAAACVGAVAGCSGGSKASATGKVVYAGKQLKTGTVTFYGADGVGVSAVLDAAGTFTVAGLPAGTSKVTVSNPSPSETATALSATGRPAPGQFAARPSRPVPKDPNWVHVPPKFGMPETSGITIELKSGQNDVDINIK